MKKKITIGKARSFLYGTAKFLGDINSIKRGRIANRLSSRILGKVSGRITGKLNNKVKKIIK